MSARVLNPVVFSELYKLRSPSMASATRNLPCNLRKLNTVKRDLFGSASPVETKKVFEEEIVQHQEKATKKWGFDFRHGHPLVNCKPGNNYTWERVAFPEIMPEMYTLTRAAHVRDIIDAVTESDVLMDDKANRENNSFDESSEDERLLFKTPSSPSSLASRSRTNILSCHKSLGKRQPRITEYMKERKRLSQTPKKLSPAKRQRTSSGSSSSSSLQHFGIFATSSRNQK